MQAKLPADRPPALFPTLQPPMQTFQNKVMEPLRTARESGSALQKRTIRPFHQNLFLSSFLHTHIPFRNLVSFMPTLRYILSGLWGSKPRKTSFYEPLSTNTDFGRRTQIGPANIREMAVDSSKISRLTAKATRLQERLDASVANCHHFRIQLCFMQDKLGHKESEFSALATPC